MLTAAGDAVHVLPVLTALKRHMPASHVTWMLQPGPASLVRGHPALDEIIVFERARGWRAFLDVRRQLATRPFDVVLDLQTYLKAGVITAMTRAPRKLGYDRARARDLNWIFTNEHLPGHEPQHVQDEYLEFLAALGVPAAPLEWNLGPWPHERDWRREFAARFERPIATLVIGSSKPEKDWIAERWADVADVLAERYGMQTVLAGARSPRELATERIIMERARHKPASMLDSGLRRLVSILDCSSLVISLDTGPLHMAVALGRPTISLLGYANPKRVGPYRRFRDLMIDAYGDPGEDYPVSMDTRPGRMPRITVEQVVDRVAYWDRRYAPVGTRS